MKNSARIGLMAIIFTLFFSITVFAKPVVPSGEAIGIRLELGGLLVTAADEASPLQKGDFIQNYESVDEFFSAIKNGAELNILRKGKIVNLMGSPALGVPKLKNNITGIGTLTYYDVESSQIYAIGHKMIDIETGIELPFESGSIYKSKIAGIKRNEDGKSSELRGTFSSANRIIGKVISNQDDGIVGNRSGDILSPKQIETGKPVKGPATILSTVKGDKVEEYSIEIEQVLRDRKERSISIKVTDESLLASTGGIAAGMSGSPILQNGMLVGVVTHVSVSQPQFGYGRTID